MPYMAYYNCSKTVQMYQIIQVIYDVIIIL